MKRVVIFKMTTLFRFIGFASYSVKHSGGVVVLTAYTISKLILIMENQPAHTPDTKDKGQEEKMPQQPNSGDAEKEQQQPKVEDPPAIETPQVPGRDQEVIHEDSKI